MKTGTKGLEKKKSETLDYSKAICHCEHSPNHCCGIFMEIKDGELVCNECGMSVEELIRQIKLEEK